MTHDEIVRPMTKGQIGDIGGTLIQYLPDLSYIEAQQLVGKKSALRHHFTMAITNALWDNPLSFDVRVIPQLCIAIQDGSYDNVDKRLFGFPIQSTEIRDTRVYLFPNPAASLPLDWPERALAERGFRAARIEELAAFGAKHPDIQRAYSVHALGSRKDGISPVLYSTPEGIRYFFGLWIDNRCRWEIGSAFLAAPLSRGVGGVGISGGGGISN